LPLAIVVADLAQAILLHDAIVYLAGGVSNIWLPSLPGGGSGLGKLHAEASHGHLLHNINSNNADGNPPKIPGNFTIND